MADEATTSPSQRKIFCVITQGQEGGAQRFIAQLASHLDSSRFSLHVVWGAATGNDLARLLPAHVTHSTARHLVRQLSVWHDTLCIGELRGMMRAYRPDIVLCMSSKAGVVASRAAHTLRSLLPGLKVIYRIGGWSFNDPISSWKRTLYEVLERVSAPWKDVIVVNNQHDLLQARRLNIKPRTAITCIYNGVDADLPFLSRQEARAELAAHIPQPSSSIFSGTLVGTIANLYETKGIATLIDAAVGTTESTGFVVIGDGPLRDSLQERIRMRKLEHRFVLCGSIPDAWRLLRAFDMFVLPSLKEGFSWAILEALAARVPIIATRVGVVPEILEHAVHALLSEPASPLQLSRAIEQLQQSPDLANQLLEHGSELLQSKLTSISMIAQYEKLFLS